jgi:hypothetical protein
MRHPNGYQLFLLAFIALKIHKDFLLLDLGQKECYDLAMKFRSNEAYMILDLFVVNKRFLKKP